jgi:hypothetical protein
MMTLMALSLQVNLEDEIVIGYLHNLPCLKKHFVLQLQKLSMFAQGLAASVKVNTKILPTLCFFLFLMVV